MECVETASVVTGVRSLGYELPEFLIRDDGRPVAAQAFERLAEPQQGMQDDVVLKSLCDAAGGAAAAGPAITQFVRSAASSAGFGCLLDALSQYSSS